MTTLVWFKRDLRVADHPALARAAAMGDVLPLYVFEPEYWAQPDVSGRQFDFVTECVAALRDDLAAKGVPLVVRVGRVTDVLTALDPQVGEFIQLPGGTFSGVYARGAASFPIIESGCFLTVGVNADVGGWYLAGSPPTVGGIAGGGAFGKVACIGSVRGQITAFGQKSGGELSFRGEGFGVAGAGFCSPETWTSVPRSREDGWCGTGDVSFRATYKDGWDIGSPKPSAVH